MRIQQMLACLVLTGCGVGVETEEPDTFAETRQASSTKQGGTRQGGTRQGGTRQGTTIETLKIPINPPTNARWGSAPVASISLVGSELRAQLNNGSVKAGDAVVGLEFDTVTVSGGTQRLRVSRRKMDTDPNANLMHPYWSKNSSGVSYNALEVNLYEVLVKDSAGNWQPLCGTDTGTHEIDPLLTNSAMFFSGYWRNSDGLFLSDPKALSVGCWDGTAVKCARWGYFPWKKLRPLSYTNSVSLDELHKSCVRAAMADYCGSGITHTEDGTPIDIWDKYGFVPKVSENSFDMYSEEATFGVKGSACISRERYQEKSATDCTDTVIVQPEPTLCGTGGTGGGTGGGGGSGPIIYLAPLPYCTTQVFTVNTFTRGALSSCTPDSRAGEQVITVSNKLQTCSHPTTTRDYTLAIDCNCVTRKVCSKSGYRPDGKLWSKCCEMGSNNYPLPLLDYGTYTTTRGTFSYYVGQGWNRYCVEEGNRYIDPIFGVCSSGAVFSQ